jgi:predicted permease
VLTVSYQLPERTYGGSPRSPQWPDYPDINGFHSELVRRVEALPGVTAAAVTAFHPLDPGFTNSFVIVGREAELGSYPEIRIREASPHYFEALGITLLSGRDIDDGDVATAPMVTLINRAASARYFGSADPVGQQMSWWGIRRTVVGVVDDERMLGLSEAAPPAAYMPLSQSASLLGTLVVRADVDPTSLVPEIREQLRAMDPEVPVFDAAPLEAAVAETISAPRFSARLLGTLAAVALAVALMGVHGLLSYSVTQRFQEVGIRMALGAPRSRITREVVGEGLRLTGAGMALGMAGALAASGLLRGMVFGVTPTDPITYAVVLVGVLLAAITASAIPAWRASRTDPLTALRAE